MRPDERDEAMQEGRGAPVSRPNRRRVLAGMGALFAGAVGLFASRGTAKADDDDGYGYDYDDDDGYSSGYVTGTGWWGYDDDDGWDDDDWDDDDGWDDDDDDWD